MRRWIGLVVIVAGCAHQQPPSLVLNQHPAYEGKPRYLSCAAPHVVDTPSCPGGTPTVVAERATGTDFSVAESVQQSQPSLTKMQRLDKLRAILAAIDAHVAAMGNEPTVEERQMLKMSVAELRKLLDAWPDVLPEADEMSQLVDKLETTLPIEQPRIRKRMNQLADLIRVQVVLAGE